MIYNRMKYNLIVNQIIYLNLNSNNNLFNSKILTKINSKCNSKIKANQKLKFMYLLKVFSNLTHL